MAGKREYLLILFVVTCFMISSYSKCSAYGFHWQFIQQWLPSICNSKLASDTPCLKPYSDQEKFTISSFFLDDGRRFQSCANPYFPKYESNAIESERSDLDEYWPNVFEKDNEKLWKSEWETKGVCSYPFLNQTEYFQKALELRKNPKYDLFASLSRSEVVYGKKSPKYIKFDIQTFVGKMVSLRCSRYSENEDIILLSEIVMCFEGHKVFELTDCPDFFDEGCTGDIYWPKELNIEPPSTIKDH